MSRLIDADLFVAEFSKLADKHRDNVAMSVMFDVFIDAVNTFPATYDEAELEVMSKLKEMGECYIIPKNSQWEVNGIDIHKALEKQIPKKVVKPKGALNEYYHEEECPHCKTEFKVHVAGYRYKQVVGETHYCPNCGQKLDWE